VPDFLRAINTSTDIKFVNTSMHGVGHVFVEKSFERFGFNPFTPVKEQQHPDPEFPTVQFPNPEEAGTPHVRPIHYPVKGTAIVKRFQELW